MTAAEDPVLDPARLDALRETGLMDAAPAEAFERITHMVSEMLGVPVALVSLVGADKQRFASAFGLPEEWSTETPLSHSFCQHVVARSAPLVVDDAREDPLVQDNLAIRDLDVIAYAGMPLQLEDGQTLGALCAIDGTARHWSERELQLLRDLAAITADAIRLRRALVKAAGRDGLTGLDDRGTFRTAIASAAAEAGERGHQVAVLGLGLDGFALVNAALGHDAGDTLLQQVAERLRGAVEACGTVARLGGDTFGVLCEQVADEVEALALADRVRAAVCDAPYVVDGEEHLLAASVGLALGRAEDDAETLVEEALAAMARAKEHRGAGHGRMERELAERAGRRLRLRSDTLRAHLRGETWLAYQPLVDLASGGRVTGFEALLRWDHPELGPVEPDAFIPCAEVTGAIVPLGEWVLRQACADAAAWRRLPGGEDVGVSVNVAPVQLAVPSFASVVRATLEETGLPPSALTIEIVERALLHGGEAHRRSLQALAELGVAVALDDFGTGYSAFDRLAELHVDVLKIDRSFVAGIAQGERAAALVEALVALGGKLGLRTVAEGVEEADQARLLQRMGCATAQGWHFGRPTPVDGVAAALASGGPPPGAGIA